MPWYVVYKDAPMKFRQGELPVTGITKPFYSEVAATLKRDELEGADKIVLDVFYDESNNPYEVMKLYRSREDEILIPRFGSN